MVPTVCYHKRNSHTEDLRARSGDGAAGEEPAGRGRGRPARRDGRGLHLHHAGGARRRPPAGNRRVPRRRLRAPLRARRRRAHRRRRRHRHRRAHSQGALPRRLHRYPVRALSSIYSSSRRNSRSIDTTLHLILYNTR